MVIRFRKPMKVIPIPSLSKGFQSRSCSSVVFMKVVRLSFTCEVEFDCQIDFINFKAIHYFFVLKYSNIVSGSDTSYGSSSNPKLFNPDSSLNCITFLSSIKAEYRQLLIPKP